MDHSTPGNMENVRTADRRLPAIGDVIDDRYRVHSFLARGNMGVVVRAVDERMQRDVAIKFLRAPNLDGDTAARRFEREVLISKELNHHHVVQVYDFGRPEGLLYLVMEYLDGDELKELISQGPMPSERVIEIGIQMLEGLAEAHAISIIHRDLKPGNIFVTKDRRGRDFVKILDFGIAKNLTDQRPDLTSAGNVCGTPGYMAPETFLKADVNAHTDIYAVGLILVEMLFGSAVIPKESPAQMMLKHLQMEVVLPPRLENTGLGTVLMRAVDKIPQYRYANADDMLLALQEAQQTTPSFKLSNQEISSCFEAMREGFLSEGKNAKIAGEERPGVQSSDSMIPLLDRRSGTAETLEMALGEDWEMSNVSIHQPDSEVHEDLEPRQRSASSAGEVSDLSKTLPFVDSAPGDVVPEPIPRERIGSTPGDIRDASSAAIDYRDMLSESDHGSSISALPIGTQEVSTDPMNRIITVLFLFAILGGAAFYFGMKYLPEKTTGEEDKAGVLSEQDVQVSAKAVGMSVLEAARRGAAEAKKEKPKEKPKPRRRSAPVERPEEDGVAFDEDGKLSLEALDSAEEEREDSKDESFEVPVFE